MLITPYTTSSSVIISGLAKWLPASIHACLQDCFTAVCMMRFFLLHNFTFLQLL